MFQCLPGLYIAVFDKVPEEAKYHPLTRFALMAFARKKKSGHSFPLCSILPSFDKGRKFGAYNGHLHSSQPATRAGIFTPIQSDKN